MTAARASPAGPSLISAGIEPRRWQISARNALEWREWEGEIVLYDERTGATHRLHALATPVWNCLAGAKDPLDLEAIAKVLAPYVGTGDALEGIADVIAELQRLRLIEARPG